MDFLSSFISGLMNNTSGLIFEIGIVIIAATFIAYFARLFKQPLIPAYVIAGFILGPLGLGVIQDTELIKIISEIGIIFLLFIVGMEIDLSKLKSVGWTATIGGIAQVVLTFALGFGGGKLIGLSTMLSMYVGLILAFSSTMIVIKLLSDQDEISTLHGRIIIGILLIQDILVIFVLSLFVKSQTFSLAVLGLIFGKTFLLILLGWLANKFIVTRIFRFAAKSEEFLFLLSLSMCFIFSLLAYILEFSMAVGAFIGGVAIANLPYNINIIGRVKPLKDFFSTIFFVSLGMQLVWIGFGDLLSPLALFLVITLLLKPFIILILLGLFGYGKRTAFISAVSLAQISEFGLILVTKAKDIVGDEIFAITIISAVITISTTAYFIKYKDHIFNKVTKGFNFVEAISFVTRKNTFLEHDGKKKRIVLFGAHRMGAILLKKFKNMHKAVRVVDFNPEIIDRLIKQKVSCMYGDMGNEEVLKHLCLHEVQYIISTVPKLEDNLFMLKFVKEHYPKINVIVTASHLPEALDLYEASADYVIVPNITSGESLAIMLDDLLSKKKKINLIKKEHLKHVLELDSEA